MDILASNPRSVRALSEDWKAILRTAFRTPGELAAELGFPESQATRSAAAHAQFRVFAPRPFVELIERGRWDDPLLRQIWADPAESQVQPHEQLDPVGDGPAQIAPGVLRKYAGRALLVLTGACAIHCRYCFRRNWAYDESPGSLEQWENSLASIESDSSIREVILSGGDPLMWDDDRLESLVGRIERLPFVARLRLHTRMPVAIPQRVTAACLNAVSSSRLATVVVIHANHPRELSPLVRHATRQMSERGWILLNQSVLLAGVNDDVDVLAQLSERLIEGAVLPYYLHQLDPVNGSSHFAVPLARGKALLAELRDRLPGYLVPRYVLEQRGESSKTVIA
jgi:EF-P beta-lysylation protein EpmB